MLDPDISTSEALGHLSVPEADVVRLERAALDRRRFLQLVGGGLGAGLVAGPGSTLLDAVTGFGDQSAWAAGPIGANDGVLVVIGMFGGNDGYNTVVPTTDGRYYDQHADLAISPTSTLRIDAQTGLHPALTELKRFWDADQLAIVEGVGYPNPDLSHFNSMAWWMSGRVGGIPDSGWLGRWLDGHLAGSRDLFAAAEIGHALPLHLLGRSARGTVVPAGRPGFGSSTEPNDLAVYQAVRAMHSGETATWHGRVGQAFVDQLEIGARLAPVVPAESSLPDPEIVGRLEVIARLINANLGFRVLTAGWGDFDSHAGQPDQHGRRMQELNAALARFFELLHPRWAGNVTVMTFSEFGRTSYANDGQGTDHGTSAPHFVLGARVKGGRYGERPSLAGLRRWDRAPFHVDFRDYFGSVVDGWLGGGGHEVFGRRIDDLGLFVGPPLGGGSGGGALPPGASPGTLVPVAATRIADTRKGLGAARRALGPDSTLRVAVAGVGPVPPTGVRAVVANITLVRPTQRTHFRVFAGGARRPDASTVNAPAGEAVPNLCVVPVGADGTIAVYNAAGHAHCVVDVFGYYAAHGGTRFSSLAPGRLLDTRTGVGARSRTVRAGEEIVLQVAGREGVPATGVTAAALNLTTVGASARGHVVAWRTGASRPETSNLNYVPGRAIANLAIVPVDANGRVSLWVSGGEVDLVADVVGSFGASGRDQFVPLSGSRVLSTRDGIGAPRRPLGAGREIDVALAGVGGVPAGASAALLNVTAVQATRTTHLRVYPVGTRRPNASALNVAPGLAVANLVIAKLGTDGAVRVFNANGEIHVLADVTGYFV